MIKVNLNKKRKGLKGIRVNAAAFGGRGMAVYLIAAVAAAAVLILFLQFSMERRIGGLNANIKIYNQKTAMIMPRVVQANAVKKINDSILQKINTIKTLKKEQAGPIGYLYYIVSAVPRFSWITSLKSAKGNIAIDGVALDGQVVSLLMDNLAATGYFDNVTLIQTAEVKKQGLRLQNFNITMNIK